jgi:methanogenic corrinoid protein MtbC1
VILTLPLAYLVPTMVDAMAATMPSGQLFEEFLEALLALDRLAIARLLRLFAEAAGPLTTVEQLVVPALERIGEQWEQGHVSLAQVYMSGRICEEIVDTILPPCSPERIDQPPLAIAVLEDYHLLGKRILYAMLRASGFELKDYGRVDAPTLARRAAEDKIAVLLISVLMLPSALRVREVRRLLDQAGCRPVIVVGGAPFRFDAQLWREVGADAMGASASDGVTIVRGLLKERL